jgi:hypothetical protein
MKPAYIQCQSCAFWQQHTDAKGDVPAWGFCLRYPPVAVARVESDTQGEFGNYHERVSSSVTTEWPETRANEWCGEWQAKEEGERMIQIETVQLRDGAFVDVIRDVEAVKSLVASLTADKERLDWLQAHPLKSEVRGGSDDGGTVTRWGCGSANCTLRETIDTIRAIIGAKAKRS